MKISKDKLRLFMFKFLVLHVLVFSNTIFATTSSEQSLTVSAQSAGINNQQSLYVKTLRSEYSFNDFRSICPYQKQMPKIGLIVVKVGTNNNDHITCYQTYSSVAETNRLVSYLRNLKKNQLLIIVSFLQFTNKMNFSQRKTIGNLLQISSVKKASFQQGMVYIGRIKNKPIVDALSKPKGFIHRTVRISIMNRQVTANLNSKSEIGGDLRYEVANIKYNSLLLTSDSRVNFTLTSENNVCFELLFHKGGREIQTKCRTDGNKCLKNMECILKTGRYSIFVKGSTDFNKRGVFKMKIDGKPLCTGKGFDYRGNQAKYETKCISGYECRQQANDTHPSAKPQCPSAKGKNARHECGITCAIAKYCRNIDQLLKIKNINTSKSEISKCSKTENGQECLIKCKFGYTSNGANPLCNAIQNKWTRLPHCYENKKYCVQKYSEYERVIKNSNKVKLGNFGTYTCRPGYVINGSKNTYIGKRKCVVDTNLHGKQVPNDVDCIPEKFYCDPMKLAEESHVNVVAQNTKGASINEKMNFKCIDDYEQVKFPLRSKPYVQRRCASKGKRGEKAGVLDRKLPACREIEKPEGPIIQDCVFENKIVSLSSLRNMYLQASDKNEGNEVRESVRRVGNYAQKILNKSNHKQAIENVKRPGFYLSVSSNKSVTLTTSSKSKYALFSIFCDNNGGIKLQTIDKDFVKSSFDLNISDSKTNESKTLYVSNEIGLASDVYIVRNADVHKTKSKKIATKEDKSSKNEDVSEEAKKTEEDEDENIDDDAKIDDSKSSKNMKNKAQKEEKENNEESKSKNKDSSEQNQEDEEGEEEEDSEDNDDEENGENE